MREGLFNLSDSYPLLISLALADLFLLSKISQISSCTNPFNICAVKLLNVFLQLAVNYWYFRSWLWASKNFAKDTIQNVIIFFFYIRQLYVWWKDSVNRQDIKSMWCVCVDIKILFLLLIERVWAYYEILRAEGRGGRDGEWNLTHYYCEYNLWTYVF